MIERIAILGTGLLGTSVGLALRAAGYRGRLLDGIERGARKLAINGRHRLHCSDATCKRPERARLFC